MNNNDYSLFFLYESKAKYAKLFYQLAWKRKKMPWKYNFWCTHCLSIKRWPDSNRQITLDISGHMFHRASHGYILFFGAHHRAVVSLSWRCAPQKIKCWPWAGVSQEYTFHFCLIYVGPFPYLLISIVWDLNVLGRDTAGAWLKMS